MATQPLDPKRVFDVGWSFSRAAALLVERYTADGEHYFLAPLVVNSAFAVEVYLKCLLLVEGKGQVRGHKLRALFDTLDPAHRERIKTYYDEDVAAKPYVKRIEAGIPDMKFEVEAVLDAAGDAFVDWRYLLYEERGYTRRYYGFEELGDSVERLILELNPGWRPE